MASTYSSLKIELIGTGEQSGTWGTTTNTNLGTAIEEAITGSADVTFSSANVTLTLTNTNSAQTARNLRLNLVGTTGAARDLIVPAIEKVYIVNNGCAHTVTVKNATGTGIAVPAGKTMYVYNDATNVVDAITHLTTLTLGTPLAIADGGTGSTTATFSGANITALNAGNISTGTLAVARGGTGLTSPGTSGNVLTSNGTDFVSQAVAAVTPTRFSAGTTGFTPSTLTGPGDITLGGVLNIANGGTGSSTATFSGANITALNAGNISTGTLAVARGGTGITAAGTSGNVLTSNGTAFVSQALPPGVSSNVQTFNSNGTWTKPAGTWARIQVWAGGGGGGRGNFVPCGGGGGGGYNEITLPLSSLGSSVTVTIGAGGAGRTGSPGNGTVGGNSSFGSDCVAYGGGGGGGASGTGHGGGGGGQFSAGGTGSNGLNVLGATPTLPGGGEAGYGAANWGSDLEYKRFVAIGAQRATFGGGGGGGGTGDIYGIYGGPSVYGGGGGGGGSGGNTDALRGIGGTSVYAGSGGNGGQLNARDGLNGTAPSGGGGGGTGNPQGNGGSGAAGRVVVTVM